MERRGLTGLMILLLVVSGVRSAAADETVGAVDAEQLIGRPIRVETVGGGIFQGTLLTVTPDRLEVVESDGQIVALSRGQVKRLQAIPAGKGTRGFYQDSAANRLIFAPTGFAMEPGELHITDTELLFVTASYGLNDHVSFWCGISPLGVVASARGILPIGTSFALSAGTFVGLEWLLGLTDQPVAGLIMPYALGSWGEPENNLTIGCAWALTADGANGLQSLGLAVVVGGKIVLTATAALVSENWLIWGERIHGAGWDPVPLSGFFALAFRVAGGRLSWDIGVLMPLEFDGGVSGLSDGPFVPLPWLSVTYRIR
jgi:hypothetical protein